MNIKLQWNVMMIPEGSLSPNPLKTHLTLRCQIHSKSNLNQLKLKMELHIFICVLNQLETEIT